MGGSKIIKDAVHGHIEIPALCVRIIDTPQFQRLRFLKQLGTTFFVYPAASHSRFEHCVGTCYLAGKMVNALRSRQEELRITEKDVLCVQIAGLCHDLGHGAFSHVFETFMKESEKSFQHEEVSCRMFDHLLSENHIMQDFTKAGLDKKDVQFIKDLILGEKLSEEDNGRTEDKAFLFEIVNNKRTGADVDKWDYFLRDCHGLGINVTFEYDRLVHFSRAAEVEGEWQIVFKEAEAENLYEMNHARMMLHKKAYQHRVVKIIDRMLVDALLKADDFIEYEGRNGRSFKLSEVCNDMAAYTYLTDDVIQRILRKPTRVSVPESYRLKEAKLILNNILARNLYSYAGEFTEADVIDVEITKQTLKTKFPGAECLVKEVKFGSEDGNPLEKQHFYRRGNRGEFITLRAEQISKMLPREFVDVKYHVITKDNRAKQDIMRERKRKQITEFLEKEKNKKTKKE